MTIGQTFRLRPIGNLLRTTGIIACGVLAGRVALANPPPLPENFEAPDYVPEDQDLPPPPPPPEHLVLAITSDDVPPPPPPRPPPTEPPGEEPPDPDFVAHPADPDEDRSIDDMELSSFAMAWLRGETDDDIALSSAAQIWLQGGGYTYDANASDAKRWIPASF